jgi:acetyl esterase/lipase
MITTAETLHAQNLTNVQTSSQAALAMKPIAGHATRNQEDLSLRRDIRVRADTPPTFLLQAENDDVDGVEQPLAYYVALQKAGVPTEMHLYAKGGHAFGLRAANLPIGRSPELVEQWLQTIGMLGPAQGR